MFGTLLDVALGNVYLNSRDITPLIKGGYLKRTRRLIMLTPKGKRKVDSMIKNKETK